MDYEDKIAIAWGGIYLLLSALFTAEAITLISAVLQAPSVITLAGGITCILFGFLFLLWLAVWSMQ